ENLRAIQSEESFSDLTQIEWEPKKKVPWPLIPEGVIKASEEENDPKYEGDEGSSDSNSSSSSQWKTSDDDESQIEVVINSRSTSLTTPKEETLTEKWKVNKSLADQVKQEDAMMNEFIKWLEDDQEETFEPQAIDIGAEGISIEKDEQAINIDMPIYIPVFLFTKLTPRRCQKLVFAGKTQCFENEFFLYNHPILNNHIAARELNLRQAIYWVDFYSYSLIANDPNELLILQNQMQDEENYDPKSSRAGRYTAGNPPSYPFSSTKGAEWQKQLHDRKIQNITEFGIGEKVFDWNVVKLRTMEGQVVSTPISTSLIKKDITSPVPSGVLVTPPQFVALSPFEKTHDLMESVKATLTFNTFRLLLNKDLQQLIL
ncbi:27176_t:CDS:2, partial [Dentiscutata erythropus]